MKKTQPPASALVGLRVSMRGEHETYKQQGSGHLKKEKKEKNCHLSQSACPPLQRADRRNTENGQTWLEKITAFPMEEDLILGSR